MSDVDCVKILADLRSFGVFRAGGVIINRRAVAWAVMAYFRGMSSCGAVPYMWVLDLREWKSGSYESYLHYIRLRLDLLPFYRCD